MTQAKWPADVKRRMCGRKKRFLRASRAQAAAKKIRQVSGENMHAYPCPICKGWHLGH